MYAKGLAIPHEAQREVLARAIVRARGAAPTGVVVFDLDSTLLDNRPRQARILREFGAEVRVDALTRCQPEHWVSWDIAEAMRNAGCTDEEIRSHAINAKAFWRDRFFTSPYCVDDIPVAGAVAFVSEIAASGAQIAYVTVRHTEMGDGTIACFRREGFPLPDGNRVHLLLKPTFEMSDDAWKQQAYARLDGIGPVAAAFDNEPSHINGYAQRFPDALCVHLATDDSGRPVAVSDGIPAVADFRR